MWAYMSYTTHLGEFYRDIRGEILFWWGMVTLHYGYRKTKVSYLRGTVIATAHIHPSKAHTCTVSGKQEVIPPPMRRELIAHATSQ